MIRDMRWLKPNNGFARHVSRHVFRYCTWLDTSRLRPKQPGDAVAHGEQ